MTIVLGESDMAAAAVDTTGTTIVDGVDVREVRWSQRHLIDDIARGLLQQRADGHLSDADVFTGLARIVPAPLVDDLVRIMATQMWKTSPQQLRDLSTNMYDRIVSILIDPDGRRIQFRVDLDLLSAMKFSTLLHRCVQGGIRNEWRRVVQQSSRVSDQGRPMVQPAQPVVAVTRIEDQLEDRCRVRTSDPVWEKVFALCSWVDVPVPQRPLVADRVRLQCVVGDRAGWSGKTLLTDWVRSGSDLCGVWSGWTVEHVEMLQELGPVLFDEAVVLMVGAVLKDRVRPSQAAMSKLVKQVTLWRFVVVDEMGPRTVSLDRGQATELVSVFVDVECEAVSPQAKLPAERVAERVADHARNRGVWPQLCGRVAGLVGVSVEELERRLRAVAVEVGVLVDGSGEYARPGAIDMFADGLGVA